MARVLRLPDHGRLLVCTDLQGCLRDYEQVVARFEVALDEQAGDAHLIFTGDLVHGPHLAEEDWPEYLGEYYRDQSGELIDAFAKLAARHPGRVHALLGNHEHGHVGGPHTAKFARDEVALLEATLGPARAQALRALLRELPLVALTPCGAVLTHGAPAAEIRSVEEIERAKLDVYAGVTHPVDILEVPVIGQILWARSAPPEVARRFVRALGGTISIYGHDVIPEGFERIGDEQIIVSTSFGIFDDNKVYLDLDLSARYATVHDLRVGHEILPLYPDKAPPRLGGRGPAEG
jgi:3',5'-cyclic AMP phosphodiesterase CpdA